MTEKVTFDAIYVPSDDVVAREIEGEIIIVPLTSGIEQDALFTLNETGKTIWNRLDGQRSLKRVAEEMSAEYEATVEEIEKDVLGLVTELVARKMLVEVGSVPAKPRDASFR